MSAQATAKSSWAKSCSLSDATRRLLSGRLMPLSARKRLWSGEEVHWQLEAVGTFHGLSHQLVQGGQHGIDARQRVRLGPAQRREPQGRQIPLQRPQVELSQRQVMQQVEGAGPVLGRD